MNHDPATHLLEEPPVITGYAPAQMEPIWWALAAGKADCTPCLSIALDRIAASGPVLFTLEHLVAEGFREQWHQHLKTPSVQDVPLELRRERAMVALACLALLFLEEERAAG